MRYLKYWLVLTLLLSSVSMVIAQDEGDDELEGVIAPLWLAADSNADADAEPRYVAFFFLDDDTIIEAGFGADVIYTPSDDGTYNGAPLVPAGFEFSATLEIVDDQTITVASTTSSGVFSTEANITYTLTDLEAGIWIENPREVLEFSKFGECMGRIDASPPGAFTDSDPIVPIVIDEEAGEFWVGPHILTGGDGSYELEVEGMFGQFADVTTRTATVDADGIAFRYHSIADGRDDCEMTYESTYSRFDGDFEALFMRVEEMIEAE